MKLLPISALLLAASAFAAQPAVATEAPAPAVHQGFDVSVPFIPKVVRVGREDQLRYEVHLTSFSTRKLTLTSISVVDDATGRPIARFEGSQLEALLDAPGAQGGLAERRTVDTGRRLVAYIDVTLTGPAPAKLRHRLDFTVDGSDGEIAASIDGGHVAIDHRPAVVLGPPLNGGPWIAVYHPTLERGHRRVVYAVAGKAVIPGRFAIDWMAATAPLGGHGSFGAKTERDTGAIAVADGVVVAARDGFAEPAAGAARPRVSLADATGNYVALRLTSGQFAFYEHLSPGIPVKVGDRVRRGQVIGRMGSTGSASRPHLHFHIADANSPLAAEGMPYSMTDTVQVGAYGSVVDAEAALPWRATAPVELDAFPPPNAVVMFPRQAKLPNPQ